MEGGIDAWKGIVATGEYEEGFWMLEKIGRAEEVLALARTLEEGSRVFYSRVAEVLPGDEEKGIFSALAGAEREHVRRIDEACRKAMPDAPCELPAEGRGLEGYMEGGAGIDQALAWVSAPGRSTFEVLELAMQFESNALDLYLKIADREEFAPVRDVLEGVIDDEKAHLKRLGEVLEKHL